MADDILIVDDDPDAREILDLVLGTLEIPVRQANDGHVALELVSNDPPLLIVLDLTMPHMDGQMVIDQLKADPMTAEIPIMVFTASDVDTRWAEQLRVPSAQILTKGKQSMTHLRQVVTDILGDAIKIDLFQNKYSRSSRQRGKQGA